MREDERLTMGAGVYQTANAREARVRRTGFLALLALTSLAGCNTDSPEKYAATQQMLRASPAIKQDRIHNCAKSVAQGFATPDEARALAKVVNSTPAAAPRIFCQRYAAGMTSGRMSYADYLSSGDGVPMTPNLLKILQGF